jgi:hypothetical protein
MSPSLRRSDVFAVGITLAIVAGGLLWHSFKKRQVFPDPRPLAPWPTIPPKAGELAVKKNVTTKIPVVRAEPLAGVPQFLLDALQLSINSENAVLQGPMSQVGADPRELGRLVNKILAIVTSNIPQEQLIRAEVSGVPILTCTAIDSVWCEADFMKNRHYVIDFILFEATTLTTLKARADCLVMASSEDLYISTLKPAFSTKDLTFSYKGMCKYSEFVPSLETI